jgi:hypothetical protein
MEDIEYVFLLLSINGGSYVEMRIHCPPPASVAAYTVVRLDLAKNFHPKSLYSLLHLQYGCPGPKAMELILKGERTRGVPTNVTIPEFFRCPICNKEKTNSLPGNDISDKTFLPIGVRFHGDFGFYNSPSIWGFTCFLLVMEAVTGFIWLFCCRSKHPPINLLLWFIRQLRLRLNCHVCSPSNKRRRGSGVANSRKYGWSKRDNALWNQQVHITQQPSD